MSEFGIMGRSNTTQNVVNQLREDIILCRYQDGEKIRELALAEKYGASRSAVRNALLILEREGLVLPQPNGTKHLCHLGISDIEDIYDLRSYIETKAIEQIFHRPHRSFSALMEVMNRLTSCGNADVYEILRIDAAFHREAIAASGNKALTQAWDTMDGITQAVFHLNMAESPEYMAWFRQTFEARHRQLLAGLISDEEQSKQLFAQHIEDARQTSLKALSKILEATKQKK